jgi:hypothetical protein
VAWTSPLTGKVGQLVTVSFMNEQVRDNLIFLHDPPVCVVFHNTSQTFSDGAAKTLNFDSEQTDPGGLHSVASAAVNPFITPTVAGTYLCTIEAEWATDADGGRYLRIRKNPSELGETVIDYVGTVGAANIPYHCTGSTFAIDPTLSEELYVEGRQNAGGNLNIPSPPFFAVHWISG